MFQILIKDDEGRNVLQSPQFEEKEADFVVEQLSLSGISAVKVNRETKKYQVVKVFYKTADIHDQTRWRTYADPDKVAMEGDIVLLQNTDGTTSEATVVETAMKTVDEIKAICAEIHYKKLGKVIKLVWRPNRK